MGEEASTEGGIGLVAGRDEEVDRGWLARLAHLDRGMGDQLRGVDADQGAMFVGNRGNLVDGRHPAGHVRRAGHRDQLDVLFLKHLAEGCHIESLLGVESDANDVASPAVGKIAAVMFKIRH